MKTLSMISYKNHQSLKKLWVEEMGQTPEIDKISYERWLELQVERLVIAIEKIQELIKNPILLQ